MKKLIQVLGLVTCISTVGVAPSFAETCLPILGICLDLGLGGGGGNKGGGGNNGGGGAPAPEIGASAVGLLLAGGVALYLHRRRRV